MDKDKPLCASQVRLKDIADELGVSVSVVSKALHNTRSGTHVSVKRCEMIRRKAEQMGYTPDIHARSLVSGKSYAIGLVARRDYLEGDRVNIYLSNIIAKAMEMVQERNYLLSLIGISHQSDDYGRVIDVCNSRQVDGLLICPTDLPSGLFAKLREMDFPMAGYFGKPECCLDYNQVLMPEEAVTLIAARHLYQNSRRRLLYMHYDIPREKEWERHEGTAIAQKEMPGLHIDNFKVNFSYSDPETINNVKLNLEGALKEASSAGRAYDGIIGEDYFVSEIACRACIESGFSLPSQISLISLQENTFPQIGMPKMTAIKNCFNAGTEALRMLFDYIETGKKHKNIHQTVTIVVRET